MTINPEIFPAILDSIQENMVLLDKDFRVLYCNNEMTRSLFSFFGRTIQPGDDYRAFVVPQSMELFTASYTRALNGETIEVEHETTNETFSNWYRYKVNPVYDTQQSCIGVLLAAKDINTQKKTEIKLKKANHKLLLLHKINTIVNEENTIGSMLRKVCTSIVEDGEYKLAWIGQEPDSHHPDQTIHPQYAFGELRYLQEISISMANEQQQRGPTITCLRTGKTVVTNNVTISDYFQPWLAIASKHGICSSLVLPLLIDDKRACLNIYSHDINAFDEAEVEILEQIVKTITKSIISINHRLEKDKALYDLNERVKEMRTLHDFELVLKNDSLTIDEVLEKLAALLPKGWQYDTICHACVRFDGAEYKSPNYRHSQNRIEETFTTLNQKKGSIEICYDSTQSIPFLAEEIQLLRTIADLLTVHYNKNYIFNTLKKTQANLLTVFNNTDIGYSLVDNDLSILEFNKAIANGYKRLTGFDLKKGLNWNELLIYNKKLRLEDVINRVRAEKRSVIYESEYEHQGSKEYFTVNISPVLEENTIIGFIIAAIDITDKKLNELERHKLITDLMQRNRDLEQFAYIVSHNLRAPVTNILGLTYLFKSDRFNASSLPRVIDGLIDSAKKLDDVIIDLDETLRIRRQITDKFEWILFEDIIRDILKVKEAIIQEKKVMFSADFSQVDRIYSVRPYLLNIFTQIIRNSIKFSRPNVQPEIRIWTEKRDQTIVIHCIDNGEGIDTDRYQDQLFGLYKRFNLQSEGRGVGLFMVKNQVETLNGTIELKSRVGEGTHIIICFPIIQP